MFFSHRKVFEILKEEHLNNATAGENFMTLPPSNLLLLIFVYFEIFLNTTPWTERYSKSRLLVEKSFVSTSSEGAGGPTSGVAANNQDENDYHDQKPTVVLSIFQY